MRVLVVLLVLLLSPSAWSQNKMNVFKAQDGSFQVVVPTKFSQVPDKGFLLKLVSSDDQIRVQKRRIPAGRKVNNPKAFLDAPPTWKVEKKYMGTIGGHPVAIVISTPDQYEQLGMKAIVATFERGEDFYQVYYAFPAAQRQRAEADFKAIATRFKWLK